MNELFEPRLRDKAISTTCCNLLLAGRLKVSQVAEAMSKLSKCDDYHLARYMDGSQLLWEKFLEERWGLN